MGGGKREGATRGRTEERQHTAAALRTARGSERERRGGRDHPGGQSNRRKDESAAAAPLHSRNSAPASNGGNTKRELELGLDLFFGFLENSVKSGIDRTFLFLPASCLQTSRHGRQTSRDEHVSAWKSTSAVNYSRGFSIQTF